MIRLIETISSIAVLVTAVIAHEAGHAVVAKKQGLYDGVGATLFGPHVKLKDPLYGWINYLSGLAGSLVVVPFAVILPVGFSLEWMLFALVAISTGDILVALSMAYHGRKALIEHEDGDSG